MNNPEVSLPIKGDHNLLNTLRRNLPKILMAGSFIVFGAGCVLNPQAGDVLTADRKVVSDYCPILPGTKIELNSSEIVSVAGAANQLDTVWHTTVPGCGDVRIANGTITSAFTRVKP